jgi:hypothetical protein
VEAVVECTPTFSSIAVWTCTASRASRFLPSTYTARTYLGPIHMSHCLDASPTIIQAPRRTSLRPDVGQETLLFSAGGLATGAKPLPHREKPHKHGWEAWGDCIAAPRRPRLDRGPSNQSTHGPPAATFGGLEGVSDSEKYVMPLTD